MLDHGRSGDRLTRDRMTRGTTGKTGKTRRRWSRIGEGYDVAIEGEIRNTTKASTVHDMTHTNSLFMDWRIAMMCWYIVKEYLRFAFSLRDTSWSEDD